MFKLNTNVKGLIITTILAVGLLNIKDPYIYNNINQKHFSSEQTEIKPVTQPSNSKDKTEIKENQVTNPSQSKQQLALQENTKQVVSKEEPGGNQLSRGGSINSELDITLTFYTSLGEENGGFSGINCSGKRLTPGTVANNVLPLGTEIYTKEFGTLTVSDRGGNNFNTISRLDVYISREAGESDKDYLIRVNNMGRVKVKGYVVKQ
jgi:3D (Asp-Asp-Asp) domain-containing protein